MLYCYNARKTYPVTSKKQQHFLKQGFASESWILVLDFSSLATSLKAFLSEKVD